MRSTRIWLILGLLLGIIVASVGTYNGSRTRHVTYKKTKTQYVSISIRESYDGKPTRYYLQLFNGSIYFLNISEFSPDHKPPDIYEGDAVSLVYDADDKEDIDASPTFSNSLMGGGPGHIKGEGHRIVQITTGYAHFNDASYTPHPTSYPSNEYLEHPNSYSLDGWSGWTGRGLLIGGAALALLCGLLLYWRWYKDIFLRRDVRPPDYYPIQSFRWKR